MTMSVSMTLVATPVEAKEPGLLDSIISPLVANGMTLAMNFFKEVSVWQGKGEEGGGGGTQQNQELVKRGKRGFNFSQTHKMLNS